VIQKHIDAGISLCDAVNFIVEKYDLVRTDRPGFSVKEQPPFISSIDILRARKATGLYTRGYKPLPTSPPVNTAGGPVKLSVNVEADSINVLALNIGRIVVDIDGIELADLINVVCDNGYSLRVADEPGKLIVKIHCRPRPR
jgi:hypothetical protein